MTNPIRQRESRVPAQHRHGRSPSSTPAEASHQGARQAFTSLSEQWLQRAKEQAQVLFAAANPVDIAGAPNLPDVALSLEPAAQSLQKAGQGALARGRGGPDLASDELADGPRRGRLRRRALSRVSDRNLSSGHDERRR